MNSSTRIAEEAAAKTAEEAADEALFRQQRPMRPDDVIDDATDDAAGSASDGASQDAAPSGTPEDRSVLADPGHELWLTLTALLPDRSTMDSPDAVAFCRILCALHVGHDLDAVIRALPDHRRALDGGDLRDALACLGLLTRAIGSAPRGIVASSRPIIAVLDKGERILVRHEGGREVCLDLLTGRQLSARSWRAHSRLRLEIVAMRRDHSEKPRTSDRVRSWMKGELLTKSRLVRQVIGLSLLANAMTLATPMFVLAIYVNIIARSDPSALGGLAVGATAMLAVEAVVRARQGRVIAWIASRMDHNTSTSLFEKILALSGDALAQTSSSSLIARIRSYEGMRDFFCGPIALALLDLPLSLIAIAVIWTMSGTLAICVVAAMTLCSLNFLFFFRIVADQAQHAAQHGARTQQFKLRLVSVLKEARRSGLIAHFSTEHAALARAEASAHARLEFSGSCAAVVSQTIVQTSSIATVAIGATLVWSGDIGGPVLIASMLLIWRAMTPIMALSSAIPRLVHIIGATQQVDAVMALPSATHDAQVMRVSASNGMISARSLTIRRDQRSAPAFISLTMDVFPGETIAISGPDGSGRSTLMQALLGALPPVAGAIALDGVDLRLVDRSEIARKICLIDERPPLLDGSIRQILRIVKPSATQNQMCAALIGADLSETIEEAAALLDQRISASGRDPIRWGQDEDRDYRQLMLSETDHIRLSIAQALLRDPLVLLIDDLPVQSLNAGVGVTLRRIMRSRKGRASTLIVTQDTRLIRLTDRVLILGGASPRLMATKDIQAVARTRD